MRVCRSLNKRCVTPLLLLLLQIWWLLFSNNSLVFNFTGIPWYGQILPGTNWNSGWKTIDTWRWWSLVDTGCYIVSH